MTQIATITAWVADKSAAAARVAKFNAQVTRWGLSGGTADLTFSGESVLTPLDQLAADLVGVDGIESLMPGSFVRLYEATVEYLPVKLPGDFTLAAVVTHGGSNTVLRAPTFDGEIDPALWTAAATCDHCGYDRARNETILVHSAAEGFVRVGTTCIRPYLGVDGAHLLSWGERSGALLDEDFETLKGASRISTEAYVTAATAATLLWGFAKADADRPTKQAAYDVLFDRKGEIEVPARTAEVAAAALTWAQGLTGNSDFELNVKGAATADLLDSKGRNAGLLAFVPEGYLRSVAKAAEKATKVDCNDYLAPVGDKVTVTGRITRLRTSEGYAYNSPDQLSVTVKASTGHTVVIQTTVATAVGNYLLDAAGDDETTYADTEVTVVGKVKKHLDYNDRLITVLSHCKAV